jgi:alpha-methylacyl-CoA racemase
MVDSSVSFLAAMIGLRGQGYWRDDTGANFLSGAAHFYDTYQTRDGKWLAVGAIEPQFHALLIQKLGLDPQTFAAGVGFSNSPYDELVDTVWPALKEKLAAAIARHTRAELEQMFAGTDACITPVLSIEEAARHPHNVARSVFIEVDGVMQNAPVPRFSRTLPAAPRPPSTPGEHATAILAELGYRDEEISSLRSGGALPE